jgi:hypothetical protein
LGWEAVERVRTQARHSAIKGFSTNETDPLRKCFSAFKQIGPLYRLVC